MNKSALILLFNITFNAYLTCHSLLQTVWTTAIYEGPEAVRAHVMSSLKALQLDYVDAMLVHWPVPGKYVDAYKELLHMQQEGLVRSVGLSNATIEDIEELTVTHGLPMPAINQIEGTLACYLVCDY
jgi:diketogulonate reductase-like aldo/keto reductase